MHEGSEKNNTKQHVRIPAALAQDLITELRKSDKIDNSFKIFNKEGFVYIPVKEEVNWKSSEMVNVRGMENSNEKYPRKLKGSYDLIGSIAIIHRRDDTRTRNLADDIIENTPSVKSVFLDTGITGEHRIRELRLLAGVDSRSTVYRENGMTLNVDLSRVYFSPRLATERMRVARASRDGETIIDMFAGIGPFSILIARNRKAEITAIDSNPDAVEIMKSNLERNRLIGTVTPVCSDSLVYMKKVSEADRIIMNLPHDSSSFLKAAVKSLRIGGTIHYYEICTLEKLEERMEFMSKLNLEVTAKREVHGYSKSDRMYGLELRKIL